jgi:hypothetical protein
MPDSFPIQKQPQDSNWCWAAVGVSVNDYFLPGSALRQCELATHILNDPGCCGTPPTGLDKTAYLQDVLRRLSVLREPPQAGIALAFEDIRTQIDASLPVCVRIGWPDQSRGHFVVICGYAVSASGEQWVDIADPYFENSTTSYNDFVHAYQGNGEWTDTFLLKEP